MTGFSLRLVLTVVALLATFSLEVSQADTESPPQSSKVGFVTIEKGRELYVDYQKPAQGKPTLVLLNGLTYRIGSWNNFVHALDGEGFGILRYDPEGQGQTLVRRGIPTAAVDYKEQVQDLEKLLRALKIQGPIHLVSLSYGGAIALEFSVTYPKKVASIILMAPFLAPIESQDLWIRGQIQQTRLLYPNNPYSFDELYDYFLKIVVYTTFPAAEPIVLEHPYKLEATYRLVQGVRKFSAKDIVNQIPAGKIHLMIARQDQYVENAVHDKFWKQLPKDRRVSRLYIEGSEHKIPEVVPRFSAKWVKRIVNGDPAIGGGKTYVGGPFTAGEVKESSAELGD